MQIFAPFVRKSFFSATGAPPNVERQPVVGKWLAFSWRDHRFLFQATWACMLLWLFLINTPSAWSRTPSMEHMIQKAAHHHNLDPALLKAVVAVESDFNPRSVSSKGALGLMQLMPGTAHDMGLANPFNPEQNLRAGARYLKLMLERFPTLPMALAAYNAGPTCVDSYGGIPPYPETRQYIRKVLEQYWRNANASLLDGSHGMDQPDSPLTIRRGRGRVVLSDSIPLRPDSPINPRIIIRRSGSGQEPPSPIQLTQNEEEATLQREGTRLVSSGIYIHQRLEDDIPIIRLERSRRR
ncbi:MAG: lytic transglycosylase domain-containing protein [Magnetococcales bacterium]|nr:lytic transglycosylase domain-containing protein [Magnetococcales bacterium]